MISNTIRTSPGVVMVTLSIALMQKPKTQSKPDVQKVDIER